MDGALKAGFEVAQQGIDPTELGQVVWVLPPGDNCLVVTASAEVTARKQARLSESTWLPGARWC